MTEFCHGKLILYVMIQLKKGTQVFYIVHGFVYSVSIV